MAATPGYNTEIPDAIRTPDRVETRIGGLEFRDGFPTRATSQLVYDHLDFLRGVEVFLNFLPAASLEAMRLGMASLGATAANQVVILDRLLDSNPLFLTGNTDTVYVSGFLDLERDGPTVVEVPPGSGPGPSTTPSSGSSSTWARPGPTAARAASTSSCPTTTTARSRTATSSPARRPA